MATPSGWLSDVDRSKYGYPQQSTPQQLLSPIPFSPSLESHSSTKDPVYIPIYDHVHRYYEFQLVNPKCIKRLDLLKDQRIVLHPNLGANRISDSSELLFPTIEFNLTDLSFYLATELSFIFGHSIDVWLVGRAARHVISGVDFNDFDLCIYSQNIELNKQCLLLNKRHYLFRKIRSAIVGFIHEKLDKLKFFQNIGYHVQQEFLISSHYLTNLKVFNDGSGCIYSFGNQVDVKIILDPNKPKSLSDVDGFNICLNSPMPMIRCSKGKDWCLSPDEMDLAIKHNQERLFSVAEDHDVKDLMFRLVLESTQGFELHTHNVANGINRLLTDYPTQKDFTNVFCRHQKNHCKNQMSRVINFLSWLTYTAEYPIHSKKVATAWLEGSKSFNPSERSESIEQPLAIFLAKYPEATKQFLIFLQGHFLMKFCQSENHSLHAYVFPFTEPLSKPRESFGFNRDGKTYYLFTGQTPLQIASNFFNTWQIFISFLEDKGGIEQLKGLFAYLGLDDPAKTAQRTSADVIREVVGVFVKKPISNILREQYRNSLPLSSFYKFYSSHIKQEDLSLLKNQMGISNLEKCLKENPDYPDLKTFVNFILEKEESALDWLKAPFLLSELLHSKILEKNKTLGLFKEGIANGLPAFINRKLKTATLGQLQFSYSLYEILNNEELLSLTDKNALLLNLFKTFKIVELTVYDRNWVEKLCQHLLNSHVLKPDDKNPENIELYISLLKHISISRNPEVLLNAFHHIENLFIVHESHQELICEIILNLIRNASVKKTIQFDRQIAILMDYLSKNHRSLLTNIFKRGGKSLVGLTVNVMKNLISHFSNDQTCAIVVNRTLNLMLEILPERRSYFIDVFYECFNTFQPFSGSLDALIQLGESTIRILKYQELKLSKQTLLEFALRLSVASRKDNSLLDKSRKTGSRLICAIFIRWPQKDASFDLFRQQILKRITHHLIKDKLVLVDANRNFSTYVQIALMLSKGIKKTDANLEALSKINPAESKLEAIKLVLASVKENHSPLLEVEPFLALKKELIPIDYKEEQKLECVKRSEEEKMSAVSKSAVKKSLNITRILENKIKNYLTDFNEIVQDSTAQKKFKEITLALSKLLLDNPRMECLAKEGSTKILLEQLLRGLIESPKKFSALQALTLFKQMNAYGMIESENIHAVYLRLIDKFTTLGIKSYFVQIETCLHQIFNINNNSINHLDEKAYNEIVTIYQNLLEQVPDLDLKRTYKSLRILYQGADYRRNSKLIWLNFTFIVRSLLKKDENLFASAVELFKVSIDAGLFNTTFWKSQLETLCLDFINNMPKSWKDGEYDTELKALFQSIQNNHPLFNFSSKIKTELFAAIHRSGNHALFDSIANSERISSEELLKDYCLRMFRKIKRYSKQSNASSMHESIKLLENNLPLMQKVSIGLQWNTSLTNLLIRLFVKTRSLEYHNRACRLFIENPISIQEFPVLIQSFINLSDYYYDANLGQLFIDVVNHYVTHRLPFQKECADEQRSIVEYKRLILTFLVKFIRAKKVGREDGKILLIILNHFDFVKSPETNVLLKTCMTSIQRYLVDHNKIDKISRNIDKLKEWMPLQSHFDPNTMQEFVFSIFEVFYQAFQFSQDFNTIKEMIDIIICAYENKIFQKQTVALWHTKDISNETLYRDPKSPFMKIHAKVINLFSKYLCLKLSDQILPIASKYMFALIGLLQPGSVLGYKPFLDLERQLGKTFFYDFAVTNNEIPIHNYLSDLNKTLRSKLKDRNLLFYYTADVIEPKIIFALTYSLVIFQICDKRVSARTPSIKGLIKAVDNESDKNVWITALIRNNNDKNLYLSEESLKSLKSTIKNNIDTTLGELRNFPSDLVEKATAKEMILSMIIFALHVLCLYQEVTKNYDYEMRCYDWELSQNLYLRKMFLLNLIENRFRDISEFSDINADMKERIMAGISRLRDEIQNHHQLALYGKQVVDDIKFLQRSTIESEQKQQLEKLIESSQKSGKMVTVEDVKKILESSSSSSSTTKD